MKPRVTLRQAIEDLELLGSALAGPTWHAWRVKRRIPIQAFLRIGCTTGINFLNGEGLLMAPTIAVSDLLKRCQLNLGDFDYYEIHDGFAAQLLAILKAWESEEFCQRRLGWIEPLGSIDRAKLNVKGSSLAIGHPFAATGARMLAVLAKLLHNQGGGRGLISLCTAGGMGVAAILEGVDV
jgi:acetyl-CoA C-acetyltransferase